MSRKGSWPSPQSPKAISASFPHAILICSRDTIANLLKIQWLRADGACKNDSPRVIISHFGYLASRLAFDIETSDLVCRRFSEPAFHLLIAEDQAKTGLEDI